MATPDEEKRAKNAARQRAWYWANVEKARQLQRDHHRVYYRAEHGLEGPGKERIVQTPAERAAKKRESSLKAARELRARVIAAYGGCCKLCGYSDARALQIDHVNGGGTEHRVSSGNGVGYSRQLIIERDSGEYQLLCANCHIVKTSDEGIVRRTRTRKPDEELFVNRRRR